MSPIVYGWVIFINMKIIITEEQNRTISDKLKSMVKKYGWEKASKSVGGVVNLLKIGFDNNPMEFLNQFNDLNIVQSEDWALYHFEKGKNMMMHDKKNEDVFINYDDIWSFLESGFGLDHEEIQEVTEEWLSQAYNLRGITAKLGFSSEFRVLSQAYNLRGITERFGAIN